MRGGGGPSWEALTFCLTVPSYCLRGRKKSLGKSFITSVDPTRMDLSVQPSPNLSSPLLWGWGHIQWRKQTLLCAKMERNCLVERIAHMHGILQTGDTGAEGGGLGWSAYLLVWAPWVYVWSSLAWEPCSPIQTASFFFCHFIVLVCFTEFCGLKPEPRRINKLSTIPSVWVQEASSQMMGVSIRIWFSDSS